MKKILNSLPFKLLLGVAVGIVLGLVANEAVMNVVVTIKQVLGQIITFCVPLIVIGFIAPSITKLGHNASRMLGIALIIAYVSSVGAALMSTAAGYTLIPHLSIVSQVDGLRGAEHCPRHRHQDHHPDSAVLYRVHLLRSGV